VKLSDLRGKVWVVAEFFAVCPHCAVRNGKELREIYEAFGDHPDFQIVCISVDPQQDDVEKLKDYAEALGADSKNWWFLNAGDEKSTHEYLEQTLKFLGVRERTDPAQIEANGRFEHDMGILAVNRDFSTFGKWDLAFQRSELGTPEGYKAVKASMMERLRAELDKKPEP
jgi:protein SCO1/2